jgi:hypothetical protein
MAHRAFGVSDEFSHVVLYLRSNGRIYQHGQLGVNKTITEKLLKVKKRLGYDF